MAPFLLLLAALAAAWLALTFNRLVTDLVGEYAHIFGFFL
jgi:hypothetical protein